VERKGKSSWRGAELSRDRQEISEGEIVDQKLSSDSEGEAF